MSGKKKRTPAEVLRAIEEQRWKDEAARIAALSDAEVDAEIRADGGDPQAIRARGKAFVDQLLAPREEPGWRERAKAKLEAVRALADKWDAPRPRLSRKEIEQRIEAARHDARFAQPVAALFRKRSMEESSDEELLEMLDEIELLRRLADEKE